MKKAKRLLASTMLCTLALQSVAFATGSGATASTVALESTATNGSVTEENRGSITRVFFGDDLNQDSSTLPAEGGKLKIGLMLGINNRPDGYETLRVKAEFKTSDGLVSEKLLPLEEEDLSLKKGKRSFSVSIPENEDKSERTITLYFNCWGDEEKFQDAPILTITQEAGRKKVVKAEITKLSANKTELAKGGEILLHVKGKNLTEDNLFGKVYREEKGEYLEDEGLSESLKGGWEGLENNRTKALSLPDAEGGIQKYKVQVGTMDAPEDLFSDALEISVGGEESKKKVQFMPRLVSLSDDGQKITVYFYEKVSAAKDMDFLKKSIFLKTKEEEGYAPLEVEDELEFVDDHTLEIRLHAAKNFKNTAKIKVEERSILDINRQVENNPFESFLQQSGVISEVKIEEGTVLSSEGGQVRLRIKGQNLSKEKFRMKVLPNKAFSGKEEDNIFEPADLKIEADTGFSANAEEAEKEGLVVSFSVPKNESKEMKSFTLRLSADGGMSFKNRFSKQALPNEKLVLTQLYEGQEEGIPAISFASIQSYGTSGGGTEVVDNTHTVSPTGQGSKKTLVHLYGINLDEKKSKIKIVDENDITWYPVNDATSDSSSNFIMIAFNHTGITGNGNSQVMEVICPNNFKGDRTFTYYIAPDGVHYDMQHKVTATVLDDKTPNKLELSGKNIRAVKVSYVDVEGNILEDPEYIQGYSFAKVMSFGIAPKDISGYKAKVYRYGSIQNKKMQWTEGDIRILDNLNIKDMAEIQFVYEKDNTGKEENPNPSENTEASHEKQETGRTFGGGSGNGNYRSFSSRSSVASAIVKVGAVLGESRDTTLSGTWQTDDKGWWLSATDGTYPKSRWAEVHYEGRPQWFYFGEEGYMATDWIFVNGKWYYLNPLTGAMHEGWLLWKNQWYYLSNGSGEMKTGEAKIGEQSYNFDEKSGALK
ncbi:glucan-binding YG repeat protein [Oribacterium sinus]|uniref:Glucan-binding YG repeat protein n=1 Tax=Oribacterium sinus TaxID=237576 RepID=A0A7W9SDZ9_9FIRM|nr:BACON domain-containing carbohydrate-binding protein [Oribacterium sinus]MBB6040419.1 glucan-binding YG repeat protein [Oribacterium sinus]